MMRPPGVVAGWAALWFGLCWPQTLLAQDLPNGGWSEHTAWWGQQAPRGFGLAACLSVALALWLGWAARRRGGSGRAFGLLTALRILAVLLILWALRGPVRVRQHNEAEPARIAIVLDNSRSMDVAPPGVASARERALGWASAFAEALRKQAQPGGQDAVTWANLEGPCQDARQCLASRSYRTDLAAAIRAAERQDPRPLAAVVLVSDGRDDALARQLQADAKTAAPPAAPVSAFFAPAQEDGFDLRLAQVTQDEWSYVKTTSDVHCSVALEGARPPAPVVVELVRGLGAHAQVVDTQVLAVPTPKKNDIAPDAPWPLLEASFAVRAETVGEDVYRCRVQPQPHEWSHQNNELAFVRRTLRDKIRVLHVVGRPSFDERFLRQELQNDRNVDVVSFFILRTPASDISVPEKELSLIPFPIARLLTQELKNFDLVVLQNFDFRPYAMTQYIGHLKDAVEEGLGLLMVGGPQSFGAGGYADTPLAEALPCALPAAAPVYLPGTMRAQLAPAGLHHPLLDVAAAGQDRARTMAQLPPLVGLQPLGAPLAGASLLLEGQPTTAIGGPALPLLVAREVGRGRTLALATDGSWAWAFGGTGSDASARVYSRLWRNSWRWLTHDPALSRIFLAPHGRHFEASQALTPLEGHLRALGADWRPMPDGRVTLAATALSEQAAAEPAPLEVALGSDGQANFALALPQGAWQLQAHLDQDARAQATVVVRPPAEDRQVLPAPATLAALTASRGGHLLGAPEQAARTLPRAPQPLRVTASSERPAWANWPWLVATLATFVLAFWRERRLSNFGGP